MTVEQLGGRAHPSHESATGVSPPEPDVQRLHTRGATATGLVRALNGIWVISDEIYEHLLAENGGDRQHIVKLAPGTREPGCHLTRRAALPCNDRLASGWMIAS